MPTNPFNEYPINLGRVLALVYGIDARPYDTELQLWVKVAVSLGVTVTPYDDLDAVLSRIANAGSPAPSPPGDQSFSVEPAGIDTNPITGLFFGFNNPAFVGVTSLTVNHTTNSEGYDFNQAPDLQAINFPNLESLTGEAYVNISQCDLLTSITFPKLATAATSDFTISSNPVLGTFEIPELASCFSLAVYFNDAITTISFPELTSLAFSLTIQNNPALTSLNCPILADIYSVTVVVNATLVSLSLPALLTPTQTMQIANNPMLTTLSIPAMVFTNAVNQYDFSGNDFSAATVNAILAQAVSNPAYTAGGLRLEGGTNAAPTGQGIADKATLQGRGVTVTTN